MPHKNITEILGDEHCNIEHYMRLKKKPEGIFGALKTITN